MSDYSSDSSASSSRSSSSASSASSTQGRTPASPDRAKKAADNRPVAITPVSTSDSDTEGRHNRTDLSRASQQPHAASARNALIADVYKFFRVTSEAAANETKSDVPGAQDPSVEAGTAGAEKATAAADCPKSPGGGRRHGDHADGEAADGNHTQVLDLLSLVACKRQGLIVADLLPLTSAVVVSSTSPARAGSPHSTTTTSGAAALNATASSVTSGGSHRRQPGAPASSVAAAAASHADEIARKRAALRSAILERRRLVGELAGLAQSYEPRRVARLREEISRQRRETPSATTTDPMEADVVHIVEHGRSNTSNATRVATTSALDGDAAEGVDAQRARALNAVRERGARAVEKLQRIHDRQLQSDVQQQLTQQQLLASLEARERAFRALRRRRDRELRHRAEVATAAREEKLRTLRVRHDVLQAQRLAEFVEKRERADERLDGILAVRQQQQKERRAVAREQFERVRDGARAVRKAEEDEMWAMELQRRARDGASMEARDLINARKDLVREMRRQKRQQYHAQALEYRAECLEQLEVRRLEAHLADAGPKVPLTYHRILGASSERTGSADGGRASRSATPAAGRPKQQQGAAPSASDTGGAAMDTATAAPPSGMTAHLHTSSAVYLNPQPRRAGVNASVSSTHTNTAGSSPIVGAARKALDDKRDAERVQLRERRHGEQRAADLRALEFAAKDRREAAIMHERDLEREAARRARQREVDEQQETHDATLQRRRRAEAYRAAIDTQLSHNAEAATEARRTAKAEADAKMQAVRNALERERERTLERLQRDRLSGKQQRAMFDAASNGDQTNASTHDKSHPHDANRPQSPKTKKEASRSLNVRDANRAASTSSTSSSASSSESRSYSSDSRSSSAAASSQTRNKKHEPKVAATTEAPPSNQTIAKDGSADAASSPKNPSTKDAGDEQEKFEASSSSSSSSFESDSDKEDEKGKEADRKKKAAGAAATTGPSPANAADKDLPPPSSAAVAADGSRAATAAPLATSPAEKPPAGGGAINAILQQLRRSRSNNKGASRQGRGGALSPSRRAGSSLGGGGAARAVTPMH